MPGRERTQNRELFGPWLLRQINTNQFEGVCWLDEGPLFRLPWKHLNMRNVDERDYGIFKAWAIKSGKYNAQYEDPPTWKTNFRCALNGNRMFSEIRDNSSAHDDPHKIYKFKGVHDDPPASTPTVAASTEPPTTTADQNLRNELEDEDYTLRISPDFVRCAPFASSEESIVIEELMRNVLLDSSESGIQQVLQLSQDDYQQDDPFIGQVFTQRAQEQWSNSRLVEPYGINGHAPTLPEEPAIHIPVLHEKYSQYQDCNTYQNGYLQNSPAVSQVFQQSTGLPQLESAPPVLNGLELNGFHHQSTQEIMYNTLQNGCPQDVSSVDQVINHSPVHSYHTPTEACARSPLVGHVPPLINGHGLASQQENQVTLLQQQRRMPCLTSWEVTVFYRGKEVLKQNVSNKFLITQEVGEPQVEPTDIVKFPTTDVLVDGLQVEYTNTILNSVGKGLSVEVDPNDYKLYAKRMGDSRVYWSLLESVETKENASRAKMLSREVRTEIFDFNQFWNELKGYKYHNRSSPDYTIYMSFGQTLLKPVMKRLVLVKLVPNFCTFWHQVAQQEGASSLHSELVSLQISNGSSFNSFGLDGPCLMDIDIHDFPGLF